MCRVKKEDEQVSDKSTKDRIQQMADMFRAHGGITEELSKNRKQKFDIDAEIISGRWVRSWIKADHIMYKVALTNIKGEQISISVCNSTLRNYKQMLEKASDFGLEVDAEQKVDKDDQRDWARYIVPLFNEANPRVTDPVDDYVATIRKHKSQPLNDDFLTVLCMGEIACFGDEWVMAQNEFYKCYFWDEKHVVVEAMIAALIKDGWKKITFEEVVSMCKRKEYIDPDDTTCDQKEYSIIFDTFWVWKRHAN